MKKAKILAVLLTLCMILTSFSTAPIFAAGAATGTDENGFSWQDDGKSITLTKFTGVDTAISIPSSINGKPVTTIGKEAFLFCDWVTNITIPRSIKTIESFAFSTCKSLTTITIPDTVKTIGDHAFFACSSLGKVTLPTSIDRINIGLFQACSSLATITIPQSVAIIDDYAFCDCASLESITFPKSVKIIGQETFRNCTSLTSIQIPNTVQIIKGNAFNGCTALTSCIWPSSIPSISPCAFYDCSSLQNVGIPKGVTEIGVDSFAGCTSLTNIVLPSTITRIADEAFKNCSSLTRITLPRSVSSIDDYAFVSCTSLQSVTFQNPNHSSVTMGIHAFQNCAPNLTFIGYIYSFDEWFANRFNIRFQALDPKTIQSLSITSLPSKTTYIQGQPINVTGAKIRVKFDSNKEYPLNVLSYMVSGYQPEKVGIQRIAVTYQGKKTSFQVKVRAKSLIRIQMNTSPTKAKYELGQSLDLSGTTITATYNNGKSEIIRVTQNMISGYNPNKLGTQTVTVKYQGKTTQFRVTVVQPVVSYIVTLDYGENVLGKMTVTPNEKINAPADPARNGYVFVGWFTAKSGGTKVTFPYTVTSNITFYAQWEQPLQTN